MNYWLLLHEQFSQQQKYSKEILQFTDSINIQFYKIQVNI